MKKTPVAPQKKSPPAGPAPYARALALFRQGAFQAATELLRPALAAEPNNPLLWNLAGSAAKGLGQTAAAEGCWRSALALDPGYAEAHYNLGVLLQELNRIPEAESAYRSALARPSWHPRALNNLGVMLMKADRPEEAMRSFEQAVDIDAAYGKAHHNRGRAMVALGRFEEARQAFGAALAHSPANNRAHIYRNLATITRFTPETPELREMEALAENIEGLSPAEQMELNFALGKAYEDLGERERSFRHFLAGNREKRRQTSYDEAATVARLQRIASSYPPALFEARKDWGCPSDVPIFIVGMPRSGSTLVEQILCSHPRVHGAGECEDFRQMAEAVRLPGGEPLLPDGIAHLPQDALALLGARYRDSLQARAPEARHVTDKNLNNSLHVGLIHLALPKAKIIHTRRDAVDTCLSCFVRMFQGEYPYTYDLAELGRYWRAHDALMAHWRAVLPPGVLLELNYEELVADLESQSRRLLAHCGLPWDAACLDFHQSPRPIYTSSATQVRQPIFQTSVKKSAPYGDLLQPLLQAMQALPANTQPPGPAH